MDSDVGASDMALTACIIYFPRYPEPGLRCLPRLTQTWFCPSP